LSILGRLLGVLKLIEDGKVGQHEASVEVGKLLKQIYIDSALKKSEKLDKQHDKGNDSKGDKDITLPPATQTSPGGIVNTPGNAMNIVVCSAGSGCTVNINAEVEPA
jgi:hypothetical protein